MSTRFRWTKAKYRHAHRLARMLPQLREWCEKPAIVERYHELWTAQHQRGHGSDPLLEPIGWRLDRFKGDEIPF